MKKPRYTRKQSEKFAGAVQSGWLAEAVNDAEVVDYLMDGDTEEEFVGVDAGKKYLLDCFKRRFGGILAAPAIRDLLVRLFPTSRVVRALVKA